jgi:ribosomal protein L32
MPDLQPCPHCREQKQVHFACRNCGYYNGREAIRIKQRRPAAEAPGS